MLQRAETVSPDRIESAGSAGESLRCLTRREREVASLVAAGGSNKEVARRLSITERTVEAHLTSMFEKLGVSSRLQLAIYAISGALPELYRSPIHGPRAFLIQGAHGVNGRTREQGPRVTHKGARL